ncbi:siderophore ABC transporter substrate-binding protein [Moellerella wisconsensis]|uniref:siderophore ABC transporter substrate-binding protein n=1 Tax=Moellerella wisconsensis TaxID=158849 RepID=UPI0030761D8D
MFAKSLVSGFILLSAWMLTGCDDPKNTTEIAPTAEKQVITIEHVQGKTEIPRHPKKVMVMNMETLDIMDALGAPVAGIPQTNVRLPQFLSQYTTSDYINAGTLFEPAYETLSNAQPDLILGGGRSRDAYHKLSGVAPTISMDIDNKNFVKSLTERTTQLGMIFGKEKQAEDVINAFNAKINTIKQKTPNAGKAMVILVSGGKISAYGPGSRFGFLFDELGFEPAYVFAETGTHGNIVNAELLLKLNPDWLFVIDRDSAIGRAEAQPAQQILDNALVRKTSAWKNDQVVYLDPTAVYIAGGVQTYSQLMDDINNALDRNK